MPQVKDGANLIITPNKTSDVTTVFRDRAGLQRVMTMGGVPTLVEDLLQQGYTFVPLVAMTKARVAALDKLVSLAQYDINEGYRRDSELVDAVAVVRALLDEVESPA